MTNSKIARRHLGGDCQIANSRSQRRLAVSALREVTAAWKVANRRCSCAFVFAICYLLSPRSELLFAIPPPKPFLPQLVAHDIISGKSHHFHSPSLIFRYDQSRNGCPQRKVSG